MTDRARRRELLAGYRRHRPEAAVYAIRNRVTGRTLLGTTTNLPSLRNRVEFAQATGTASALDGRLARDVAAYGLDAFELEVLEEVAPGPETSDAELREELLTLEALWREKLGPERVY